MQLVRYELLHLHKVCRYWPISLLGTWLLLAALQEPLRLRTFEYRLLWSGLEGALLLFASVLPLLWLLSRVESRTYLGARTRAPLASSALSAFSVSLYGIATSAVVLLGCIALDRIRGADLDASPWRILAQVTLVATAWACFAQVLGRLPGRWLITVWLLALLAAALLNVPAPLASSFWLEHGQPVAPFGAAVLSTVWSIIGSIFLVAAITSIGRRD